MNSTSYLVFLLLPLAVITDVNYKEGSIGNTDVVLCDCTYDAIGITGVRYHANFTFTVSTPNTTITYVEVKNLKDKWPATISKANPGGGGVGLGWITINIDNQKNHGAKFQLKAYGKLPPGQSQSPLLGNCFITNKG